MSPESSASVQLARLEADLLRYLRIREHSAYEVATYLRRRGHPREAITVVIAEAKGAGFIDDRRFARVFLRDRRLLRPMSRSAVLRELRQRGVDTEIAREALATCDPPWDDLEVATGALARRWERWPAEIRYARGASFLQRRGFSGDLGRAVIENLLSESPEERS